MTARYINLHFTYLLTEAVGISGQTTVPTGNVFRRRLKVASDREAPSSTDSPLHKRLIGLSVKTIG